MLHHMNLLVMATKFH